MIHEPKTHLRYEECARTLASAKAKESVKAEATPTRFLIRSTRKSSIRRDYQPSNPEEAKDVVRKAWVLCPRSLGGIVSSVQAS